MVHSGKLKNLNLQWLVHSHFELRRIFAHNRCMTVETDLPDVEMEQKKVVWLTKHMFLALGTLTPASQAPLKLGVME